MDNAAVTEAGDPEDIRNILPARSRIIEIFRPDMPGWQLPPVLAWLLMEGRQIAEPVPFLQALGERLAEAGAGLSRIRLSVPTLHPEVRSVGYTWVRGEPVTLWRVGHEVQQTATYLGSPIAHVIETGEPFRRKLDALGPQDHSILHEVRAGGGTDYLALPLRFWGRPSGAMIFVTDRPEGFSYFDIAKLGALGQFVAPVLEIFGSRSVARALLDTYLGPRTGARVLAGQIKRGDGETIEASIWFSDLRDFTPLTESLPPKDLLAMLNAYFELVAAAVRAHGGEILRFIGDAMLIVFPTSASVGTGGACTAALDAAIDAYAALDALNHRRRRAGQPEIRFGVGLHAGTVVYGNVGAPDRLDFTVMGPAVNRAARIESLTKELGCRMLVSAEFARCCGRPMRSLGTHPLKGVAEPQEVFAPAQA